MTPSAATRRAIVLGGLLLVAALVVGQPEAAALALPLLVGAVLFLASDRPRAVSVVTTVDRPRIAEGGTVMAMVTITADVDLDVVTVRRSGPALEPVGHGGVVVTSVIAGEPREVSLRYRARRWGRHQLGPATADCVTAGFGRMVTVASAPVPVEVLPEIPRLPAQVARPRMRAFAGAHRSRAIGEGVEFAGVRPFTYGDPPRRVNWRATARTGELMVTSTHTDRSADVVVVIDALHDVAGPHGSSVELAVRAAAAVTKHYLDLGDSVALLEYGGYQRLLAPGTGRLQMAQALSWLLDTHAVVTAAVRRVQWPAVFATKAPLAVVLTPLLDEASSTLLVDLRLRGAAVVGLDTLPAGAPPRDGTAAGDLARRLWLLERRATLDRLADLGVPVGAWRGPEQVGDVLRALTQVATAPRMALR